MPSKFLTMEIFMSEGFAQFHRKLLLNPLSNKPNYLAVWVYIVLKANHTPKDIIVNNAKMTIGRGEYLGSLQKIALHFGLSIASVKKIIDYFESEKMVNTKRTRNYTIFQIVSYDEYQTGKHKKNTKRTPSETTNNGNNDNNEKNTIIESQKLLYPDLDLNLEYDKMIDWNLSNGKKIKDYPATFRNWCRKAREFKQGASNGTKQTNGQYHKPTQGQEIDAAIARLEREYGLSEI